MTDGDGTTILRAPRMVTPHGLAAGCVVIRGGSILDVRPSADPGSAAVVELPADTVLLPGLVDSHVHVNEPGRTDWEGFAAATAAAAAGGITTIVDMPLNSIPPTVDRAGLAAKVAATTGQLAVDVAFWGGAVPGNAAELGPLLAAGVVGVKCFLLDSGVAEFPPLDADALAVAMRAVAEVDGLFIAHAEDPAVIAAAPPVAGPSYADFLAARPAAAEVRAIATLVDTARRTGCRTHVVHVSAAEALPVLAAARAEGLPVTAETCPHYLALSAEEVAAGATEFKCCPPIRPAANRDALWSALLDGTLDCVVSDHSPSPPALKTPGNFGTAWGGIASLQLGLPVVWTEAARRGIGLERVVHWMAGAPAALTRLPGRGVLAPGARADLCVFAPDETFVVDPARLHQRHPITPYAGRRLRGVVRQTWLAGAPIGPGERRGQVVLR